MSLADTRPANSRVTGLEIIGLQVQPSDDGPALPIVHWHLPAGLHWVHDPSGSATSCLLKQLAGQIDRAGATMLWHTDTPDEAPQSLSAADVFYADPHDQQWDKMPLRAVHAQLLAPAGAAAGGLLEASAARSKAALIEGFGLAPHLNKSMYMLSTGTRRKVFLMAALLAPHPLVLLDEPSAALDLSSIRTLHYALAMRKRLAGQVTIVTTAMGPDEVQPAGHCSWHLTPA